jgi:hypothetical protein
MRLLGLVTTLLLIVVAPLAAEAGSLTRVSLDLSLHGGITPTADPCVAYGTENGTGTSTALGSITYAGFLVDNFCTRGQGEGDFTSISTITAANGDKLYIRVHTPFTFDGVSITWPGGTWVVLGGTGRFAGTRGGGLVGASGIPDVTQTTPYPCHLEGVLLH